MHLKNKRKSEEKHNGFTWSNLHAHELKPLCGATGGFTYNIFMLKLHAQWIKHRHKQTILGNRGLPSTLKC